MKFVAGALALAGILLFAWTATHQLPGEPPPGAERHPGFAPYKEHCAKCHGLGGRSERAVEIADEPVSLVDPEWKGSITRSEIHRIIVRGKGDMEGIDPRVSAEDIEHIIDFVVWLPADTSRAGAAPQPR